MRASFVGVGNGGRKKTEKNKRENEKNLFSHPLHQAGQVVVHVVEDHVDRALEVVVLGRCFFYEVSVLEEKEERRR